MVAGKLIRIPTLYLGQDSFWLTLTVFLGRSFANYLGMLPSACVERFKPSGQIYKVGACTRLSITFRCENYTYPSQLPPQKERHLDEPVRSIVTPEGTPFGRACTLNCHPRRNAIWTSLYAQLSPQKERHLDEPVRSIVTPEGTPFGRACTLNCHPRRNAIWTSLYAQLPPQKERHLDESVHSIVTPEGPPFWQVCTPNYQSRKSAFWRGCTLNCRNKRIAILTSLCSQLSPHKDRHFDESVHPIIKP